MSQFVRLVTPMVVAVAAFPTTVAPASVPSPGDAARDYLAEHGEPSSAWAAKQWGTECAATGLPGGRTVEVEKWDVFTKDEMWWFRWYPDRHNRNQEIVLPVCPAEWPRGLAIDTAMEFIDRHKETDAPGWVQSCSDLMRFCLEKARKQE